MSKESGAGFAEQPSINGKKNIEKYRDLFLVAKSKYGIPPEVITAFWAMETDFGAVQGNFHTISALATLAHDCRRPEMFQQEYIAAIHLFSKGVIDLKTTGAWAGEVGQVQMLPSDILRFGLDGNKDGIIDLKKSPEDSILTAAALISELGWKPKIKFKELVKIMVQSDFEKICSLENAHFSLGSKTVI